MHLPEVLTNYSIAPLVDDPAHEDFAVLGLLDLRFSRVHHVQVVTFSRFTDNKQEEMGHLSPLMCHVTRVYVFLHSLVLVEVSVSVTHQR